MSLEIAKLHRDVNDAGLYRVDYWKLHQTVAIDMALYVACIWLAKHVPNVSGFLFAFALVRVQYHQHDVYHGQYCANGRLMGDVLSTFTGMSSYYWIDRNHKPHHAHVNDFRMDSNNFVFPWWKVALLPCALPAMILKSVYYGIAAKSMIAFVLPLLFVAMCIARFQFVGFWCVCIGYVFSMMSTQVIHHKSPLTPHPNRFSPNE